MVWQWFARRRPSATLWHDPDVVIPGGDMFLEDAQPRRGDRIASRLVSEGHVVRSHLRRPRRATLAELSLFHTWAYLEASTQDEVLARIFGLDPGHIDVARVLDAVRRGVGATVDAARAVAAGRVERAFHLGGGFHHAEPDMGSGFCVYNDVGVAVRCLREDGFDAPIAIVDLDVHQGNGNSVAFDGDDVTVYSIHGSVWTHRTASSHREIHLEGPVDDARYLACLRTTLTSFMRTLGPKLVFYIAGADVLAEDRLGRFSLSLEGAFARDLLVLDEAARARAGVVITMGGGYSSAAWLVHYNLAYHLLTGRRSIERSPAEALRRTFDAVAASLKPSELQGEGGDFDLGLTEEDVMGQLSPRSGSRRLLDYYSPDGVQVALERYGISERIRARGFSDIRVELLLSDPERQVVRVHGTKAGREHLLVELVMRREQRTVDGEEWSLLWVEWLLLQDPTRSFSLDRPRLPGQEHPGLGLASYFSELLLKICERLDLDGIGHNPAQYHNGFRAPSAFRFMDPKLEGQRRALAEALAGLPLHEASEALEGERVVDRDGVAQRWSPADMVAARSERARRYFRSEAYRATVAESFERSLSKGLHVRPSSSGSSEIDSAR